MSSHQATRRRWRRGFAISSTIRMRFVRWGRKPGNPWKKRFAAGRAEKVPRSPPRGVSLTASFFCHGCRWVRWASVSGTVRLSRHPGGWPGFSPPPEDFCAGEWVRGDILNAGNYAGKLRGIDVVIHLAAIAHSVPRTKEEADRFWTVNLEGTKALIAAAVGQGVRRFVHVSTLQCCPLRKGE